MFELGGFLWYADLITFCNSLCSFLLHGIVITFALWLCVRFVWFDLCGSLFGAFVG